MAPNEKPETDPTDRYACCFCGNTIEQGDRAAIQLIATNLWEREAVQAVYSHSECASSHMAAGQMSPEALLDSDSGYSLEEIVWGENEGKRYDVSRWTCLTILIASALGVYLLLR